MDQTWVRNYIEKYLAVHQCHFIEKGQGHLQVKLSTEVDKDLTNRPYYWTFVERIGVKPETLTITFIFDKDKAPSGIRGEEVRFGSERLKQIFHSAKKSGTLVRLYQQFPQSTFRENTINQNQRIMKTLNPWLMVNYKVEFLSDKKKDQIISLGINLATGEIKEQFFSFLNTISLGPVLPANVSTMNPFINLREAALQLEEWILYEIYKEDFSWAVNATERLEIEIKQIETYYTNHSRHENDKDENLDEKNLDVEKEKRIEEVKWQYSPRIEVKSINYGIFYLENLTQKSVEYLH